MTTIDRLKLATGGLIAVTLFGTVGYMLLGFTFLEAMYQTITTLATVGFREVRPMGTAGMIFTMTLIVTGVGVVLYNLGVLLEALTEGNVGAALNRRRMDRRILRMRGHVIVCGYGRVGLAATEQLLLTRHQVVIVDIDPEQFVGCHLPHLVGDVTDDSVLKAAGIEHARALVVCLETDAETVYATLSARHLRPDLVIIARARSAESKDKLMLAGATRAVNPQLSGGRRMAEFALHPDVAEFLDVVMHDDEFDYRMQQVQVAQAAKIVGQTLAELRLTERTGVQLLALRAGPQGTFTLSPTPDTVVGESSVLIAFGTSAQIESLTAIARR